MSNSEKFGPHIIPRLNDFESSIVKDLGPLERRRAMTEGVLGVMKMLSVAIALYNVKSEYKARAKGFLEDKRGLDAKF